jgi:hypothetical protein
MTTKKFLTVVSGTPTLTEAPSSSAGAGDANKLIATNSSGLLDTTFLPPGVELQTVLLPTSENLTAGDFVNIFDDTGTVKARKADASNNRPAIGYVLTGVTSPAHATVYLSGRNTAVTGATVGPVFLSATAAGGFSSTAPATPGANVILQRLGNAIAPTSIVFENDPPITLTVV